MKSKGLSLITLVITIVVIIILTGAIVLSLSQNNPITKATEAKNKVEISSLKDQWNIAYSTALANNKGVQPTESEILAQFGTPPSDFVVKSYGIAYIGTDLTKKQQAMDIGVIVGKGTSNTDFVVVPSGFYYVMGTKSTGVVISSSQLDENNPGGNNGDQFVWIPTDLITDDVIEPFKKRALAPTKDGVTSASLSSWLDDTLPNTSEYSNSISKYKGFYVARYEASCATISGTTVTISSKKSTSIRQNTPDAGANKLITGMLINYITYSSSVGNGINVDGTIKTGVGAKTLSEQMAATKGWTSVESTLTTGAQWDTTMQWLSQSSYNVGTDSTSWGNHFNATFSYDWPTSGTKAINTATLLNTGATARNTSNNIYDLTGNLYEWTNESSGGASSGRGGYFRDAGSDFPPACRTSVGTSGSGYSLGFRPSLYIK